MYVPPQLSEYHFHDALVPSEPPLTVKVDELPEQIAEGLADALDGAVDNVPVLTVTDIELQVDQFPPESLALK